MFGVFGIWLLASAIVMLARARKGRAAIPEGFVSGAVIACLSLALVALILIDPLGTGVLLMIIIGVLVIILGITLLVNGVRLKEKMKQITLSSPGCTRSPIRKATSINARTLPEKSQKKKNENSS